MKKQPETDPHPVKVLFIVDSLYWVIGNFANQISKNNPSIQAFTCSQFAIRKTVKRFGALPLIFDVVHFLRTKTIQGFWGKLPTVTTFHHLDPATDLTPFHQSDAVMTVSNQWHQHLAKIGIPESHQTLVPFGVDTNTFHPPRDKDRSKMRKAFNLPNDALVVGFSSRRISNVDDRKGVTCFLQALKILHQHVPNLATLIIGPGWQTLAKEIRQQNISCVQAPYEITHEQIAKYYQAMDLFWVTSKVEGGPVPLLEAMATGLPCISTPVGAALDLINDTENGFIATFDAPEQFASHSLQIAHDQPLRNRLGQEARKTILEKRQWTLAAEKLQELYGLAISNFHHNSTQPLPHNNQKGLEAKGMTVERFYSHKVQRWIQACEHINGFRMMVEMKEWKVASQFGFRALYTNPFDTNLWKELISIIVKNRKLGHPQSKYDDPHTLLTPKQPL